MGGKGSGRKSKLQEAKEAGAILHDTAPDCALYLRNVVLMKVKKPSWSRVNVAEYILDQVLGKARIRAELPGDKPLTLLILCQLAEEAEKGGGGAPFLPTSLTIVPPIAGEGQTPKDPTPADPEPKPS